MKRRQPDSFEHAITLILAHLGDQDSQATINKSAALIRKASDPDQDFMLNLHQAAALDREYAKRTGEVPPILRAYSKIIGAHEADEVDEGDIITLTLTMHEQAGKVSGVVHKFTRPESEDGAKFSTNEVFEVAEHFDHLERIVMSGKKLIGKLIKRKVS